MRLNRHTGLENQHSFLSASKSSWINYTPEKLERVYETSQAARRGTDLHNWAAETIRLGVKQAETGTTLSLYINDCIGWRMSPEQTLFYSRNAFGTADAVGFRNDILRISDLKTGLSPAGIRQLEVYAAYFCLEYGYRPFDIGIELRIYQQDECKEYVADPVDVDVIMRRIVEYDRLIEKWRADNE